MAMISCSPSTINTAVPAPNAFTRAMVLSTSAVKVTQSMMISGGNRVLFSLPVTFKNTHRVIRTSALNSWFALPNRGQMLEYPIFVKIKPHARVITVEKYLLQNNFLQPSACSISSTLNSSWKDIRPIRATESRLVRARADTHIVIKHCAT